MGIVAALLTLSAGLVGAFILFPQSLRPLLRVGWFAWLADVAYWVWQMSNGENSAYTLPRWQVVFNLVTFFGGWILLVVLIVATIVDCLRRGRGVRS